MAKVKKMLPEPKIDTTVLPDKKRWPNTNVATLIWRSLYDDEKILQLPRLARDMYIHCTVMANQQSATHKKIDYRGRPVTVHLERGEFLTSWKQMTEIANNLPRGTMTHSSTNKGDILKLVRKYHHGGGRGGLVTKAKIVGIPDVRRTFVDMAQAGLVKVKSNEIGTIVTICNYDIYQTIGIDKHYADDVTDKALVTSAINSVDKSSLSFNKYTDLGANTDDFNKNNDEGALSNVVADATKWALSRINDTAIFISTKAFNRTATQNIERYVRNWGGDVFCAMVEAAIVYCKNVVNDDNQYLAEWSRNSFSSSDESIVINKLFDWSQQGVHEYGADSNFLNKIITYDGQDIEWFDGDGNVGPAIERLIVLWNRDLQPLGFPRATVGQVLRKLNKATATQDMENWLVQEDEAKAFNIIKQTINYLAICHDKKSWPCNAGVDAYPDIGIIFNSFELRQTVARHFSEENQLVVKHADAIQKLLDGINGSKMFTRTRDFGDQAKRFLARNIEGRNGVALDGVHSGLAVLRAEINTALNFVWNDCEQSDKQRDFYAGCNADYVINNLENLADQARNRYNIRIEPDEFEKHDDGEEA